MLRNTLEFRKDSAPLRPGTADAGGAASAPTAATPLPSVNALNAANRRKRPADERHGYAQYGFPPPAAAAPVVPALTYCQRYSGLPPTQ